MLSPWVLIASAPVEPPRSVSLFPQLSTHTMKFSSEMPKNLNIVYKNIRIRFNQRKNYFQGWGAALTKSQGAIALTPTRKTAKKILANSANWQDSQLAETGEAVETLIWQAGGEGGGDGTVS